MTPLAMIAEQGLVILSGRSCREGPMQSCTPHAPPTKCMGSFDCAQGRLFGPKSRLDCMTTTAHDKWGDAIPRSEVRRPQPYLFTSLISASKFSSLSRKNVIHKSRSGMRAIMCGSSSKRTPFSFRPACADLMSGTAKYRIELA